MANLSKAELLEAAQHCGLTNLDHLDRSELISLLLRNRHLSRARPASPPPAKRPRNDVLPPAAPLQLGERLVLMVRDAQSLYAYWDLGTKRQREGLSLALHQSGGPTAYFPIHSWTRSYYLPVFQPGGRYTLELGQRSDDRFEVLLRSDPVVAPAQQASSEPQRPRQAHSEEEPQAQQTTAAPPSQPPAEISFEHGWPDAFNSPPRAGGAGPLPPLTIVDGRPGPLPREPGMDEEGAKQRQQLVQLGAPFGPGGWGAEQERKAEQEPLRALVPHGIVPAQLLGNHTPVAASEGLLGPRGSFSPPLVAQASESEVPSTTQSDRHGALALVLHAHLPFVRHPEHEVMLEEDWLFEALTETYLPLYELCQRLHQQHVAYRLTLALSPPLLSMLSDPLLLDRYERHLGWLEELLERELQRTAEEGHQHELVTYYRRRIATVRAVWEETGRDLPRAFGELTKTGKLDLLTCAATHALLPLIHHQQAVWAQIAVAVETHRQLCGVEPQGIWLPECAFYPGLEAHLTRAGLSYFVVDTHAVEHAQPPPKSSWYQPVACGGSGVHAFARDPLSSNQVWSRESGYPGDFEYRDFYRDVGFDLPREQLAPLIGDDSPRKYTGLKYHRITGPTDQKELYRPEYARQRAQAHAQHFIDARQQQLAARRDAGDAAPVVVAPYDAELFGHWWHEGLHWLEAVLRGSAQHPQFSLTHLGEYLGHHPNGHCQVELSHSSWGEGGYNAYWLSEENAWVYPDLHQATEKMCKLADRFAEPTAFEERALDQAARELMLAQASDWAFMMRARTTGDYAARRTRLHLQRFDELYAGLMGNKLDEPTLAAFEYHDNVFADLSYRLYSTAK